MEYLIGLAYILIQIMRQGKNGLYKYYRTLKVI